ncbi:hypothetical protein ERJ70_16440 [Sediminibacillus dalangtanensis]|uniref:DUF7847 domain-containing protein n=1 Tax=Sediminibacillus dalangtanensis TaxID=2729421 RepID=A0ABX7VYG8_9BACI|nr:hypothetical protein [Sediminibacillus dalangtanensis]QTN00731.1 hypothetical protein ERJ70_16440 [Sediminibacillus dalangtanensis]
MNEQFRKPKGFGEILDQTFRLSKNRFVEFFTIFLIIVGPVFLLQAIVQLLSGRGFFREFETGDTWYEQLFATFDQSNVETASIGEDISSIFVSLIAMILTAVAYGAILFAINHIKNEESYTVGSVIKQAFSRFWGILGSSLLFGVILFGLFIIPLIIIIIGGMAGSFIEPVTGIIFVIVFMLGLTLGVGLLATRWGFYLGSTVLDKESPGLSQSWNLTRKQTWKLFGLYLILYLVTGIVSTAVESIFGVVLGASVLFTILVNLFSLITSMIFAVGYSVMFLDSKTRNTGEDLQEMLNDYQEEQQPR